MSDLDLVTNTLFLGAVWAADEQDFTGFVAQRIFENSLPVVATAQSQDVCPNLVAGRGESSAQPKCKCVVLGIRMADK